METLHETIRTLRNQLRLAMNGVTATSMREKGLRYKLNFGVSYPEIKAIARQHEPNATLAHALWAEDCRELKILATLLQPAETFLPEEALRWIAEAPYPEELLATAYDRTDLPFGRATAFLLQAERLKNRLSLSTPLTEKMITNALQTIGSEANLFEQRAALQVLRFYGRADAQQAHTGRGTV